MAQPQSDEIELPVRVGERLAGKYRVERVLGSGSMGVVVAAMHEQLEERVAIKLMLAAGSARPDFAERFVREARASAKIKSSHIARVIDVGTLDDGRLYMVMEHLEGADLARQLVEHGPLAEDVAVDYVLQACEALVEAHALGIVHRDLKPSNLFLTETNVGVPLVKVLDFGISKALRKGDEREDARLTASTAIIGSPLYMSPEQIRSAKDVDERADVWALGVILHELLTCRVPFLGDTHMSILASICADKPTLLREHRPGATPELEAIVARCLEKDVTLRFQSVIELARALGPFGPADAVPSIERAHRGASAMGRSSGSRSGVRVAVPVDVMAETVDTLVKANTNAAPAKRKKKFMALAMVLGGVTAVATAGLLKTRSTSPGSANDAQAHALATAIASVSASPTAPSIEPSAPPAAAAAPSTAVSAAPAETVAPVETPAPVTAASAAPTTWAAPTADAPRLDLSGKPTAKLVSSATSPLPALSGGIRLGKEVDTRR